MSSFVSKELQDTLCFEYGYLSKELELEYDYFAKRKIINKLNAINILLGVRLLNNQNIYQLLRRNQDEEN
jgi:hypothetical protein